MTLNLSLLGFKAAATVRDLRAMKDVGTFSGNFTSEPIAPHASLMLSVAAKEE